MTYPGNASLPSDVQERILSTYRQTLTLAGQGSRQEALLGCDFILRLDPSFEAARQLRQRILDGEGPVDVGAFELKTEEPSDPGDETHPSGLGSLGMADRIGASPPDSLPDLPSTGAAATGGNALHAALADLLARRELKRLVQVAEDRREEVAGNPDLRKIVETAYSRLEAEPYIDNFLTGARKALAVGDLDSARQMIEKASSLDPEHPGIVEARATYEERTASLSTGTMATPAGGRASEADELFGEGEDLFGGDDMLAMEGEDIFGGLDAPPQPGFGAEAGGADPGLVQPGEDIFDAVPELSSGPDFGGAGAAAAGSGGGTGDSRVDELLREGQDAFDRQDYQGSIDAWSRIFLIHIDHPEASRRIEAARRLKEEGQRRAEEIYHEALAAHERGDDDAARQHLAEVIALAPGYGAAHDLLAKIERGAAPPPTTSFPPAGAAAAGTPPLADLDDDAWDPTLLADIDDDLPELSEDIMVPPAPAAAAGAKPAASRGLGGRSKNFVYIGGAVLLAVLLVAFFAWQRWDSLFPNSEPKTATRPTGPQDPVARAQKLHDTGKLERALNGLYRLPEDHPSYAEAQELIAEWEVELEQKNAAAEAEAEGGSDPSVAAMSPEVALARRDRLLDAAREAHAAGEFIQAGRYFNQAAQIAPLSGSAAELQQDVRDQLAPLSQEIELFTQREWEMAIPLLWQRRQSEPGNRDVARLLVDSYYNLGVRSLQRGDAEQASQYFGEAATLAPDAGELARHQRFADSYSKRTKDLLYRIYVKYLPTR